MTDHPETGPARLATRIAFFVAGMAISFLAPLIPFAKAQVGADEATLGLMLLGIGIGSLVAMPVTGVLAARMGAKPIILFGGFGMALALPLLMLAPSPVLLAGVLFLMGATLGSLDVSMNIHGAKIEQIEGRALMSGFHAQFSIGGFVGAGIGTGMLSFGASPVLTGLVGGVLSLLLMAFSTPRYLRARGDTPEPFTRPRGVVLLLAALCAILFLVEGAMLDWGALLLIDRNLSSPQNAGLGYMAFSVAMVIARLSGDRVVGQMGAFPIIFFGGSLTAAGLVVIVLAPGQLLALAGFALVGLGAANVVPVLFSLAGKQKVMPPGLAITAVSIVAYAGVLMGPALVGFVAHATTLPTAFFALAALMVLVPLTARAASRA